MPFTTTTKFAEAWQTLAFPNGMYDYQRINTFLQKHIGKVDPADKDSDYIFTMYFEMSIHRVVISMHENYELDFSQGAFAELLGYEKKILTGKKGFFLFIYFFYTLFTCITSNILTYRHNLHNIYILTYMTSYLHNTCHTYYTSLKEH